MKIGLLLLEAGFLTGRNSMARLDRHVRLALE
jgi:hypothetical protein